MNGNVRDVLCERREVIERMMREIENRIRVLPDGKIYIRHNGGRPYYYLKTDGSGEKILKKDDERIALLIQKDYLQKSLKDLKKELESVNRMQKIYTGRVAEEKFAGLTDERQRIVKPITLNDGQFIQRWQEIPFTPKPVDPDIPVYLTMRGERVRSKSEMIIADRLYTNGIPYKYECPLQVGKKTIHPDFSILKVSVRKVVYYEHCGKMGDPKYVKDMMDRFDDYNNAGFVPGSNLFLTFESSEHPFDVRVLDELIRREFR